MASDDTILLRAASSAKADTLSIHISIENIASHPVHLEWGACSMRLQLFSSGTFAGNPVFDGFEWPAILPGTPGITRVCPTYLLTRDLAPGDTFGPPDLVASTTIQRVAGDSLPPGRYYLRVRARLIASTGAYRERWFNVPAGEIQIGR